MAKFAWALLPVMMAFSGAAIAATPPWSVSEVSGDVRLVESGKSRAAKKGALLSSGSVIATGAGARAVIVRGEEFVVMSQKSQLRVPAAEATNPIMQLIEDFGTALYRIKKKATPHFGVQTPYLAAVVKGTTFTVTVGPDGSSVQVTEGAVEVSTLDGGAKDIVRPGGIAMVGASDLYSLSVQGETSSTIRSENAPAGSVSSPAPAPAAAPGYSGPSEEAPAVGSAIAEAPVTLAVLTDGLLEGPSPAEIVTAELRQQSRDEERGNPTPDEGGPEVPTIPTPPQNGGTPSSGNDGGGEQKPGDDKIDDGKNNPEDGQIDDGKGKPDDKGTPDDKGKPDDDKGKPDDDKGKPDDDKGKPDDGNGKPDDGNGKPDDDKGKPDDDKGKPDDGAGKPDDGNSGPGGGDDDDDDDDDGKGPGRGDDDDDDGKGPGRGGDDDDDDDDDDD